MRCFERICRPSEKRFVLSQRQIVAEVNFGRILLEDVIPFWIRHGWDRIHGGMITSLSRDGSIVDTDKSIWFQGRAAWMFATLYNTVEPNPQWLEIAESCIGFLERHGVQETSGKLYFTVTREGQPLRMRRYFYSESFAAIAYAAMFQASNLERYRSAAIRMFEAYLLGCFHSGTIASKTDPATRPMQSIGPWMIAMATAQELRANLGDLEVLGVACSVWIDRCIEQIETVFYKPELAVLMENVGADGQVLDHFDGRQLNPGHAIECAWFILHESKLRKDKRLGGVGLAIFDAMWERGWDREFGGLYYFRDVYSKPIQEYWHDMKFWWPHCEAIIATDIARRLTNHERYHRWHQEVCQWSFDRFGDPEHGEWFGYLHRDARRSNDLKGSLWKGPFHLPRMLWYCMKLAEPIKDPWGF
jgi:N-acylglucosamine 2-epimerase